MNGEGQDVVVITATWLVLVDRAAMPGLDDDDREDCVLKLRYQPEVADAITPQPRKIAS